MIYYFKILLLLIFFNAIILKTLIIFLLIYGIKNLRKFLPQYIITLDQMRIKSMFIYILNTILFILLYICLLGYWRFLNTNRTLDLKILIYRSYFFLKNNNISDTILLFICIILAIIFSYYLIKFLRKYYFYHFLKIHIFIVYLSQYKDLYEETTYEKIRRKVVNLSSFFYSYFIDKPIDYCCDLYLKYFDSDYKEKMKNYFYFVNFSCKVQNKLNLPKHAGRVPIYLIIFSISYDILYNNMLLNKFYYISFILFFYYLFQKLTDIMCCLYNGDCVTIYDYLYVGENDMEEDVVTHINKELVRIEHYGKPTYALDYDENRLIKLSWSTYLCMVNIFVVINIFLFSQSDVILNQQIINANLSAILVISLVIILWFYVRNIIIENIFLMISSVIILFWLLLLLKHNFPLLFDEILLEYAHIKIVTTYTIGEKLLFLNEYLMLKIKCLSLDKQLYLLKMVKNMPFEELLQTKSIPEIKNYVENLINTFVYLENTSYPLLKDDIQNQFIISQHKLNFIEKAFSVISKLIKILLKIKYT